MGNSSSDFSWDDYECKKCGKDFSKWIAWRTHQALCRKKAVGGSDGDDDDDIFNIEPPDFGNNENEEEEPRLRAHTYEGLRRLESYMENMPVEHPLTIATREPLMGTRVVRGPTWKYLNEDSGEGGVGTVTGSGDFGFPKRVEVTWDNGKSNTYNTGRYGLFDLLVLDTSGTDCMHQNLYCNICCPSAITDEDTPIRGVRWQCLDCFNYDLCTHCYMGDEHDLSHRFLRHEYPNTDAEPVTSREEARKVRKRGLFPTAKVMLRQDDPTEEQKEGSIISNEFLSPGVRDSVQVQWDGGDISTHKVGFGGDVELKCVTSAEEGHFYPDHLPMCGDVPRSPSVESEQDLPSVPQHFEVGDKVMICLPEDILQATMDRYGEWDVEVVQLIDKPGTVVRVTGSKFVLVEYDLEEMGLNLRQKIHSFHPVAIGKLGDGAESVGQSGEGWTFLGTEGDIKEESQPGPKETDAGEKKPEVQEEVASSSHADVMCRLCEEMEAIIKFLPCGHQITCQSCSVRIKKCFECKISIDDKTWPGEQEKKQLKDQLDELQWSQQCKICFERAKDTVFSPCGHSSCKECSNKMRICHVCRTQITDKIKLYLDS